MDPKNVKSPFASRTVWGALLVIAGLLGRVFRVEVPSAEIQTLLDHVNNAWPALMEIAGAAMAVWGRYTATKRLG